MDSLDLGRQEFVRNPQKIRFMSKNQRLLYAETDASELIIFVRKLLKILIIVKLLMISYANKGFI